MPRQRRSSLKDPELYESLRAEGKSEEQAARISNAAAEEGRTAVGKRGGAAENYEDRTVPELRARARELGITGVSRSTKSELITRLREH
ncbi:DUF7218 family protein [Gulosibacter sediminis]|uniref:DUF7218 family protein n=1 Tax=Gulosibacter sediminis TaxID=1729695 RepID=UPI0024A9CA26|nr:Rho termination factor N-terminal domain-containing protein [Gulosibacter sediminis]